MTRHLVSSVQFVADRGWGMGRHEGRFGGHPFFGMLCIAALVAGVVLLVLWATGRGRPQHRAPHAPPAGAVPPVSPTANAESILAERLARGEISADDYRSSLAALRGEPASA